MSEVSGAENNVYPFVVLIHGLVSESGENMWIEWL